MKTLIAILIIASFLESTILPINLVLLILICRSYILPDKTNFFLAFSFGLLNSYLNLTILGIHSLSYLIIITIVESLSKSRLAGNYLLIIPLTLVLLLTYQTGLALFTKQFIQLPKIMLESIFSLPILYLVKIWEERFIVRKEIKLKI